MTKFSGLGPVVGSWSSGRCRFFEVFADGGDFLGYFSLSFTERAKGVTWVFLMKFDVEVIEVAVLHVFSYACFGVLLVRLHFVVLECGSEGLGGASDVDEEGVRSVSDGVDLAVSVVGPWFFGGFRVFWHWFRGWIRVRIG